MCISWSCNSHSILIKFVNIYLTDYSSPLIDYSGTCSCSLQTYGPVGWLFTSCLWEHTHLKTPMTPRIYARPFRWHAIRHYYRYLIQFLLLFSFFQHHFTLIPVTLRLQQIMQVQYKIPDYVHISTECQQLLARIFVANPMRVMISTCKLQSWRAVIHVG